MPVESSTCKLVNIYQLKTVWQEKNLHQFFYYHNKYLNSMKYQEISMGPSKCINQCTLNSLNTMGHCNYEKPCNNEPPINIVVELIQMDDKLFKWMKYCLNG
jgi:hypothetical protein